MLWHILNPLAMSAPFIDMNQLSDTRVLQGSRALQVNQPCCSHHTYCLSIWGQTCAMITWQYDFWLNGKLTQKLTWRKAISSSYIFIIYIYIYIILQQLMLPEKSGKAQGELPQMVQPIHPAEAAVCQLFVLHVCFNVNRGLLHFQLLQVWWSTNKLCYPNNLSMMPSVSSFYTHQPHCSTASYIPAHQ